MAIYVRKCGEIHGVPAASLDAGDVVAVDGAIVAATTDPVLGIVVDEQPTDNPRAMIDVYGEGSIIEDDSLSLTAGDIVYSDGDGTYSATEPAGSAGDKVWAIGAALDATSFTIRPQLYELGA